MDNRLEIILAAKDVSGKAFAKVQKRISNLSKSVFSFQGAIVGVAGAGGMGLFVKSQLEAADSIAKVADTLGVTTKSLQEYRFMADRSGIATSMLDNGLGAFTKRLGELRSGTGSLYSYLKKNNEALAEQLAQTTSTDQALAVFLDHLGDIESQADKTALSAAAFSRTAGIKMTNLVKGGSDALTGMRREFEDLGLAIDEQYLRQAEAAVDSFTNLEYLIKARLMGSVVALAPEITNVVDEFTGWVQENEKLIKQNLPGIIDQAKDGIAGTYDVLKDVKSIFDSLPDDVKGPAGLGLVGAIMFGPAGGMLLGGGAFLLGEFRDFFEGLEGLRSGHISMDEFFGDERVFEPALKRYRELKKLSSGRLDNEKEIAAAIEIAETRLNKLITTPMKTFYADDFKQRVRDIDALKGKIKDLKAQYNILVNAVDDTYGIDYGGTGGGATSPPAPDPGPVYGKLPFINPYADNGQDKAFRMAANPALVTQTKTILEQRNAVVKSEGEAMAAEYKSQHQAMYEITKQLSDKSAYTVYEYSQKSIDLGKETASEWESAFTGWASGFSSTLNDMLWESEITFNNIAKSFGKMVTQMMIQQSIVEPLTDSFGGFFKSIFKFHSGGIVGSGEGSPGMVSALAFAGAPRFHGGGIVGDEVPIIARRGEWVLTPEQARAMGGSNVEIHVHTDQQVKETRRTRGQNGDRIDLFLENKMAGVLAGENGATRALETRYGLQPALGGR